MPHGRVHFDKNFRHGHGQIPCSHYLEWTRQHATQNTRNRKLTTVHPYRFWPRPLAPIVVLATIEALQATMPHSALERAKRGFVQVLLSVAATFSVPVKVNRDSDDLALLEAYRGN